MNSSRIFTVSNKTDEDAAKVTRDRWPDVHQYGDVTNITTQEVCEMMDVAAGISGVAHRRGLPTSASFLLVTVNVAHCLPPARRL